MPYILDGLLMADAGQTPASPARHAAALFRDWPGCFEPRHGRLVHQLGYVSPLTQKERVPSTTAGLQRLAQ